MTDPVFESLWLRMALALAILAVGVALFRALNALALTRARLARLPIPAGERQARPAAATLLYFTTQQCAPCKTVQRPAIQRLREQVGERLEVIEIDAGLQPDVAGEWGVLSVPTTFVLDRRGVPRHVNHGVTPLEKLLCQVQDVDQEL